jgi:hypothetical protein
VKETEATAANRNLTTKESRGKQRKAEGSIRDGFSK